MIVQSYSLDAGNHELSGGTWKIELLEECGNRFLRVLQERPTGDKQLYLFHQGHRILLRAKMKDGSKPPVDNLKESYLLGCDTALMFGGAFRRLSRYVPEDWRVHLPLEYRVPAKELIRYDTVKHVLMGLEYETAFRGVAAELASI